MARTAVVLFGLLFLAYSQIACGKATPSGKATPKGKATPGGETTAGGKTPPKDLASTDALRGNVVVRVGQHSITRETVDRWTTVEAILTYEHTSGRSVPPGVVPDPPRFANCIEYLATTTTAAEQRQQKPDRAQLRSRCAQKNKALREQALTTLISHYWIGEEAAKRHVKITQSEVRREVDRKFTADGERRYLETSGVTTADERFAVENQVLLTKLQRSTLPVYAELRRAAGPETPQMVNRVDFEIQKFGDEMTKRWAPRTQCRNGFVVSECGEYKAS